jgi:nitrous oxide reductase accessory protein NosL
MTRALLVAVPLATLALAACNPAVKTTLPVVEHVTPIAQAEMTCPITGETVTDADAAAYYESFPVYCKGRESARQFAALDAKQRARLGSEQVLPQKGIANKTCPLTGETLDARATAVVYDGAAIGFASAADANQFRSLKPDQKAEIIADWRTSGGA